MEVGEAIAIGIVPDPSVDSDDPEFDDAFQFVDPSGKPIGNVRYEIVKPDGTRISGVTDGEGKISRQKADTPDVLAIRYLGIVKQG